MEIFVGNLPGKTSVLELRKLIGQTGNARYRIVKCHSKNGRACCYGHAVVYGNIAGDEIISRLNGAEYNGSHLSVRPLLYRSEHNERRNRRVYCASWTGVNRRQGERRVNSR